MAVEIEQHNTYGKRQTEDNLAPSSAKLSSANALLHELQLGEKLNTSVAETRRADFSLMLAMLAEDVREQSRFVLPKAPVTQEPTHSESSLRKQFNLPDKAPVALASLNDIKQFNQAHSVAENNTLSIQLADALQAKPLAFRDDKKFICTDIINNMSLVAQLKHKQSQQVTPVTEQADLDNEHKHFEQDKPLNQVLKFNANAWLASVQESIVKAPLTS